MVALFPTQAMLCQATELVYVQVRAITIPLYYTSIATRTLTSHIVIHITTDTTSQHVWSWYACGRSIYSIYYVSLRFMSGLASYRSLRASSTGQWSLHPTVSSNRIEESSTSTCMGSDALPSPPPFSACRSVTYTSRQQVIHS